MKNKSSPVVAVLLVILIAGCGARVSYTLGPQVDVVERDGQVNIDGSVLLTGTYGERLQIKGVTVEVLINETVTDTIQLGTLNHTRSQANFSLVAPVRPDEIHVHYHTITPREFRDKSTIYHLEWRPEHQLYAEVDAKNPRVTSSVS